MKKPGLKVLLPFIDVPALRELAEDLLAAGSSRDEVIEAVVAFVDASIDWAAVGKTLGPVGATVGSLFDVVDAPIATAIARGVVRAAEKRRAARAG